MPRPLTLIESTFVLAYRVTAGGAHPSACPPDAACGSGSLAALRAGTQAAHLLDRGAR